MGKYSQRNQHGTNRLSLQTSLVTSGIVSPVELGLSQILTGLTWLPRKQAEEPQVVDLSADLSVEIPAGRQ